MTISRYESAKPHYGIRRAVVGTGLVVTAGLAAFGLIKGVELAKDRLNGPECTIEETNKVALDRDGLEATIRSNVILHDTDAASVIDVILDMRQNEALSAQYHSVGARALSHQIVTLPASCNA